MTVALHQPDECCPYPRHHEAINALCNARDPWAATSVAVRIARLKQIKDELHVVAAAWADSASQAKGLAENCPLRGEEWLAGPAALMAGCNGLIATLEQLEGKTFLQQIPRRQLANGQLALSVIPANTWDNLLLNGVRAEIWMQPGVTEANLANHTACVYDQPPAERSGKVALVLGAGNVAAISPLDVLHKLFVENQVCLLKLNPVNDYLMPFLQQALAPLIACDALRIVTGDAQVGAWLTDHPGIDEIHITGSGASHDAIVWGQGEEAVRRRAGGTPRNPRRITSELGGVSPTIVVPGPWSDADIRFQAEQLATQKLNNSGFNCVACQVLILPQAWDAETAFFRHLHSVIAHSTRPAYYPGALSRLQAFRSDANHPQLTDRGDAPAFVLAQTVDAESFRQREVFAPAMSVTRLAADSAEQFLKAAIDYANLQLEGTLGANIIIHPATRKAIGEARFTALIAELRYGTIAINTWTGVAFLLAPCAWGAFPGHTLDDIQSGIGTVHNCYMLEKTERTILEAPFRPFPRSVFCGELTLLPKPPWFVTHRHQQQVAKRLTEFYYQPGWHKLPGIFWHAMLG